MSLKKLVDLDLLGRAVTKIKALIPNAASAAPGKVASSSSQGSSANYARQDHTHGIDLATGDSNGQVKIAGNNVSVKGLAALAYKASLGKSDVGLGNVDNVKQYSASNPPPYPVTSVNGSTGAVTVSVPSAGTATPKMDGTTAVGTSAKYAKEDHVHPSDTTRVAMTGDQTVAGNKTFSGTTSLTPESIYPASTGTAIQANAAAIIQSPIPKYLWHDVWAFCRDCTPTYYTTTDGSTWTQAMLEKNLFSHKMTWGRQNVISDTVKGSRWVWATGAWNYGGCAWLLIGISHFRQNAYFDILLEQADSSGNWVTLLNKENCYYNSVPVWFKTNTPQGGTQIRLTITRNASDATTNILPITSIRWLASRWGDQGRGEELEYPYQWDADNNILPVSNNTNSLGSSSYKWKNIYVGQLNGTTIPASPKFTDTTALGSMTGTLGVDHGGTGKTTANDAANVFMNALGTGSSTPVDADYYISQYVGGGTTTTTYHRRPMSALWEYIKGKISSVLGLTASSYGGSAAKVNNHTVAVDVPSGAKFTDTTYESKAAASGGTDVSLVTTGEKATWNAKTSNVGTITGIKMNGVSKGTSGVVDLGTVITAHQSLSGKQDKLVSGTNIKSVNGVSLLGSGNLAVSGLPTVTSSDNDKVLKVVNGAWAVAEGGGGSSLPYTDAILHVKAPIGSSLTFTKGSISERLGPEAAHLNADGVYGDWYYTVPQEAFGDWTVTASLDAKYVSTTMSPSEARQYDAFLEYALRIIQNGELLVNETYHTGTVVKSTSYGYIQYKCTGSGSGYGTGIINYGPFDVTSYTKMCVTFTKTCAQDAGAAYNVCGVATAVNNQNFYQKEQYANGFTGTKTIDITYCKGEYYPSIQIYVSNILPYVQISDVWLE